MGAPLLLEEEVAKDGQEAMLRGVAGGLTATEDRADLPDTDHHENDANDRADRIAPRRFCEKMHD
jgi:hypothetical protein